MNAERCAWKGCRQSEIELAYRGKPLCKKHWHKLCAMQEDGQEEQALAKIGIRFKNRVASNGKG